MSTSLRYLFILNSQHIELSLVSCALYFFLFILFQVKKKNIDLLESFLLLFFFFKTDVFIRNSLKGLLYIHLKNYGISKKVMVWPLLYFVSVLLFDLNQKVHNIFFHCLCFICSFSCGFHIIIFTPHKILL